ncbi:unnamed protein product [Absidia cylindrospora]
MPMNSKSRLSLHTDLHSTLIHPNLIPRLSPTYTSLPPHPLSISPCSPTHSYNNNHTHMSSTPTDTANYHLGDSDHRLSQSSNEKDDSHFMDTTPSASPSSSSSSSPASSPLSPTSNFSAMDLHYLYDQYQYPSSQTFDAIVQDYLQNLSTKKRDKALVDQQRYTLILQVLKDPRNTAISTAQFRFWVKKMFQLSSIKVESQPQDPSSLTWMVCHDGKPVATQEQIYPILIRAHRDAHHGGRDKTSALVRKQYSWIPKELIARFVRRCPFCISRRNGHLSKPSRQQLSTHPNNQPTLPKASKSNINKSALCFDHQSTLKSNSLTNCHQSQYQHHHHNSSAHPYHFGGRRTSSTKSQQPSSAWNDSSHQHQHRCQSLNSSTPTIAASIATTAAASVVSTQWMEPGTPFYYYSQAPSREFFVPGTDHLQNTYAPATINGHDYASSYLGDQDGTRNDSFASVNSAPAVMYSGSYQSSSPIHSPSANSSHSTSSSSISAGYAAVGQQQQQQQQQQYEYQQNQYQIQPVASSMNSDNLLPDDTKLENTDSQPYHYSYALSSSSSSSPGFYALQSPTGSMDILSHQHQQHHDPSV